MVRCRRHRRGGTRVGSLEATERTVPLRRSFDLGRVGHHARTGRMEACTGRVDTRTGALRCLSYGEHRRRRSAHTVGGRILTSATAGLVVGTRRPPPRCRHRCVHSCDPPRWQRSDRHRDPASGRRRIRGAVTWDRRVPGVDRRHGRATSSHGRPRHPRRTVIRGSRAGSEPRNQTRGSRYRKERGRPS